MADSHLVWLLVPISLLLLGGVLWCLLTRCWVLHPLERLRRKARKMILNGQVESAVTMMRQEGMLRQAAQLLAECGKPALATALFEEAGDLLAAGKAAVASGNPQAAQHLFSKAGDREAEGRQLEREGLWLGALEAYMEAELPDRVMQLARHRLDDPGLLKMAGAYLADREAFEPAMVIFAKGGHSKEVGQTLEKLGRLDEALGLYETNGLLEPAARIYSMQGEHRRAAYLLLKAGLVAKGLDELLLEGDCLTVARMYRRLNKPDRALEVLESMDRKAPDYRDGMLMSSALLTEESRPEEAIIKLDELLRTVGYRQDMLEAVVRLADLQMHVGDVESTIETLKRARVAGIDDPAINEQLSLLTQTSVEQLEADSADLRKHAETSPDTATTSRIGFPATQRYKFVRKLAQGGHGLLFVANDVQQGFDVVLKLMNSESLPSPVARRFFLREARTAGRLDHPNIIKLFDSGEMGQRLYIAMELVIGHNLLQLQDPNRPPLTMAQRCAIFLQLGDALAHAHAHEVIHRDVKMENVMVTGQGIVKLLDFGLAKALDEDPERSLFVVGTPNYMSPEQLAGKTVDRRTDIYSLGVLMYRLLTGRLPFEDNDIVTPSRHQPPEDPRCWNPEVPAAIAAAVLRCVERDRDDRFQSVAEIVELLESNGIRRPESLVPNL